MLLQVRMEATYWEAGWQHWIYCAEPISKAFNGHTAQHHCCCLWCVLRRSTQWRNEKLPKWENRINYTAIAMHFINLSFIVFSGKKDLGFAKYTLPVPDPEPPQPSNVPPDSHAIQCSISPPSGTVLDAFDISCKLSSFCSAGCFYCFKTDTGEKVLHC